MRKKNRNIQTRVDTINIKQMIREEVQKALEKERQGRKNEASTYHRNYYNSAKREMISDLMKIPLNRAFQDGFGKSIASQLVKSIISKI